MEIINIYIYYVLFFIHNGMKQKTNFLKNILFLTIYSFIISVPIFFFSFTTALFLFLMSFFIIISIYCGVSLFFKLKNKIFDRLLYFYSNDIAILKEKINTFNFFLLLSVLSFLLNFIFLSLGLFYSLSFLYVIIFSIGYSFIFNIIIYCLYFIKIDSKTSFNFSKFKTAYNKDRFKYIVIFFVTMIFFLIILSIILNIKFLFIFLILLLLITSAFLIHYILKRNNLYKPGAFKLLIKNLYKELPYFLKSLKNIIKKPIDFYYKIFIFPFIFSITFFLLNIISKSDNAIYNISVSIIISSFFLYPVFKNIFSFQQNSLRPFIFTCFIFSLFIIYIFILKMPIESILKDIRLQENDFNILFTFLNPILIIIEKYSILSNQIIDNINLFLVPIIPFIFFIFFYINSIVYFNILKFEKMIDEYLKKQFIISHKSLIFGDSLSLYPFFFDAFFSIIISLILLIEEKPIANTFFLIFDTLQIEEIFKIGIFTKTNIDLFFNYLIMFLVLFIMIRLIIQFFSSIFSHFMLFDDEIIFLNNKIITKSVIRVPLSNIKYIVFNQNFIERLLDIGKINIETSDNKNSIKIGGISNLKLKNKQLMEKIKSVQ